MTRRHNIQNEWLVVDRQPCREQWKALGRLSRGTGVLFLQPIGAKDRRRLRRTATARELTIACDSPRMAARVHDQRELTRALLRRIPLILVSPIHATPSHPAWTPLPRMRAATLARLANRQAIALGGMNRQRYAKIAALGFIGWAGISAFRT
jgi:thiamine-phosphate pyrophosphorylase